MLRGWAARWRLGEAVRAHGREGGGEGASVRASSSRALSLSSRLLPWQVAARLQRHECVGAVKQKCRGGGRRNCGTRTLDGDLPRRRKWVMSFLEALDPPSPHREKRPPPQTNGDLRSSLPTPYCGLLDPALVAVCDLSLGRVCVCARAWCASHLSLAHSLSLSLRHTLSLSSRDLSRNRCAARRCRYARASSWRRCCWWLERRERSVWRALPSLVLPSLAHLASSRSRRRRSARRMSKKWTTRSTQSRISSPLTPS